ncbi:REP-associated tyrosine transposase [Pseudogulbenkiania subflava]|uniref:Putative transposase n=1 Tax=Pseudogulbenkiania subflava DSM 22618 TaxID=1123014 RepID=A0A1Y6C5U7_9NEIS|nr:transposase [Pseudogulbenkiania subflava]SMF38696.1 putative transposase [Pseudogulbenkiania subflava DSM 22618]
MANYRRWRVPGGTYFFTVTLLERGSGLLVEQIEALREAVRRTRAERPFHIDGWVVLPDHLHCMITLPPGDDDFANRIKAIKIRFVRALPATERRNTARVRKGERGVWQRRFWEHVIRSEADYAAHLDYIHINPFKHGLVMRVADWPFSTFHRAVAEGLYPEDWAGGTLPLPEVPE